MIKRTLTYPDLDGNSVTEAFYFNLTKAEVAELQLGTEGGWAEKLQAVAKAGKGKDIIATMKAVIEMSVGHKHEDGRRFIKNEDIRSAFMDSEAYSTLFMELIQDPENGIVEFMRGVIPAGMIEESEAILAKRNELSANLPAGTTLAPAPKAPEKATDVSQSKPAMTYEAMAAAMEEMRNLPKAP